MPVIPTLGRFRQNDGHDFKIVLGYVEISRPAWGTAWGSYLSNTTSNKKVFVLTSE